MRSLVPYSGETPRNPRGIWRSSPLPRLRTTTHEKSTG
jgi:hypothetical protein